MDVSSTDVSLVQRILGALCVSICLCTPFLLLTHYRLIRFFSRLISGYPWLTWREKSDAFLGKLSWCIRIPFFCLCVSMSVDATIGQPNKGEPIFLATGIGAAIGLFLYGVWSVD